MAVSASNRPEINLDVDAETFETPGSGHAVEGSGAEAPGPVTFGTTCWGTTCPSANTISC
ncbi:hypothetical protein [Nocardiopsis halotolerans]|uniref:hypothetical protein n=1 Tax=Nocardiopsis halotolerans TaxID=124252 RepID=UPI000345F794|nr:hypothetical protein [Nocardiopsis halotolerans]